MPQPTFRPRSWTAAGHSASTTSELRKSASIYDLTLELAEMHPIELLDFAAKSIAEAGPIERQVRAGIYTSGYFETSLLAKSMEWLVDRRSPESLFDPDTPAWLFDLNHGFIRAAKRRTEDESTSYLLEIKLPGGPVGLLQIRFDNEGGPANPWPHNRALLDFVLDEFEAS